MAAIADTRTASSGKNVADGAQIAILTRAAPVLALPFIRPYRGAMTKAPSYFFCGIGGSGMLPLAMIARSHGATVSGSDRSRDQGRTQEKFNWIADQGIALFPQDGSGLTDSGQMLVASAAIESTVPDVAAAEALGCERLTRAELLARLFNAAAVSIGIGGTSGKSSVTAMTGWILHHAGRVPTIVNGAVMANFVGDAARYVSSVAGDPDLFVSELDESDGSIALFHPTVAVLNNLTLDHKPLEELRRLFTGFAQAADTLVWNADDAETAALVPTLGHARAISFGTTTDADFAATDIVTSVYESHFTVVHATGTANVRLALGGLHNVQNALAAIAASFAVGIPLTVATEALAHFKGIHRRFERIGEAGGVTVIDDFGHNPDKVAATLATVAQHAGRALLFFQPHGYGPLKTMGAELGDAFVAGMRDGDRLWVCDPVYFGGTVDRSVGSESLVTRIAGQGRTALHVPTRDACAEAIAAEAQPGDLVVVMGARDDTLPDFARALLNRIANTLNGARIG